LPNQQINKDLEKEKPLELAFQDYYGAIMKHIWFGDGYIMLAFKAGYIVVVSSHSKELSEEIHSGAAWQPYSTRSLLCSTFWKHLCRKVS
jgi:hypothetical protein